jgi:hypothetical protein
MKIKLTLQTISIYRRVSELFGILNQKKREVRYLRFQELVPDLEFFTRDSISETN